MNLMDLSDQILNILTREYLNELNLPKSKKGKTLELKPTQLAFSDITVWFYKRQCEQSLEEAKKVWEQLPDNPLQRQDLSDFLRLYTEEIISKYEKHSYYTSKAQYIDSLINQTKSLLIMLSHYNLGGQNLSQEHLPFEEKIQLNITLDSIQGHDLDAVFQNSDLVGHHIEIVEKNDVVFSPVEKTKGFDIDFENLKLAYNLSLGSTMVTISLFEDYLCDGVQSKKLVARGEFDLFNYLYKEALNTEQDNFCQEPQSEIFKLGKMLSGSVLQKNGTRASFCSDVSLMMRVSADVAEEKSKLRVFYGMLQKRLVYLEQKLKKTNIKCTGYYKRLKLMLLPFSESIDYNGESITVNEKTTTKKHNHDRCNIF